MKNKITLLITLLILLALPLVSATCTVTFDKSDYNQKETVSATMSCSENTEKNTAYTLNWTNSSGYQIELDTGTTPSVANTVFVQTYIIPSDYVATYGSTINATLTGTDLEGTDSATVAAAGTSDLIITNVSFSTQRLLGTKIGLLFQVEDENAKAISNALCTVYIVDNDGLPIETSKTNFRTFSGKGSYTQYISDDNFNEGTTYRARISCLCGANSTTEQCLDEDGLRVENSQGSLESPFITQTWLTVNTVTDRSEYNMKDEIFICVNVTNNVSSKRVPIHIYHQVRCSSGIDNNSDLDRALIISDGTAYDLRGISVNTTQMQCKRFIIPEANYLQGKSSQCYASTNTWVLDDTNKEILGYTSSSPVFNITSDELNLYVDWERISNYTFNSIVNLSSSSFSEFNGSGIGDIDLKLKSKQYTVDATQQYYSSVIEFTGIRDLEDISSIQIQNLTDNLTGHIEVLEDGSVEIEIRDVDISSTGWYNITLFLNSFTERQTGALEGIENKTGTFHLDVECPSTATIRSDMTCTITSYIEDSQTVQKEVDFTCYITNGTDEFSAINYNQMITRSVLSIRRDFSVPSSFLSQTQYVLQCHADYYNLGSRRDSFYDTFVAVSEGGGGGGGGSSGAAREEDSGKAPITGDTIGPEGDGYKIILNPFTAEGRSFYLMAFILILLVALIIIVVKRWKKKDSHYHPSKIHCNKENILRNTLIIIASGIIIALIASGIFYLYGFVTNSQITSTYKVIEDPLFRTMMFLTFMTIITIILFKTLKIKLKISINNTNPIEHYWKKVHKN